ncbi:glutamine-rich protein 2-like isoform X2 [Pyrgilauda ruficollis]|uniref:glutamine-rich protein 2-like isoform X2 n=1 Tax=Pyrgilauda ruficollis TaxID=221976 RepID=UPI001B86D66B|nr:glutamine-rich protein 2-like isoform X2 [Pyrgilauda ruficollis]
MVSVSLLQLLDDAIGKPEVNVNLEALRRLLKVIVEYLSLLGLQEVIPEEGAQEAAAAPGQSPGPQQEEGWSGAEAGQPSQPPDELQETRSGSPVTSVAADMGQMEKTEAKESGISKATALSQETHREMAGIKTMQLNMGKEIQRIKESLGQTTDLCKDLCKEINEMKATQSRMGEGIQMIQEALGQGNIQDAAGQPLVFHDQPAPAKPHTSDMDKLGQSPGTQSTTPGMQTRTPSAQSGTTGTQLGLQAGLPAMESILRDLSELQGQMSSLQNLVRDLLGEKEKIRQLQDALGKLGVTVPECRVDGTNEIPLQLEPALLEIKQEQKELREEQNITKATLKQLVTADQLQEQLNELRAVMGTAKQQPGESHSDNKLVRKLLHRCERLQQQVDCLVPQQVQRSLPEKTQEEELLKSIQATVVRVEGDCEQLGYVTGSLRDDHRQHQKDIEALFRSLEGLEKKADKEDLLLLKVDKAALGSKVSCAHFDESMERLEERMRELLRRVMGQEQRWQEAQQQFRDVLDSKLDRLELGPFQKQLEDTWAKTIKDLKDELTVEIDDAAGIKQQLLVPFKCLSCDRQFNMQVPGAHIDTLPLLPPLPGSHAAHPSTITTEEQAQQHGHRKLVNSKFLKSQSSKGQDTSSALLKGILHLSKKPGVTELLGTDDSMDQGQEHRPEVAKRAQDKLDLTTLEHQPASELKH